MSSPRIHRAVWHLVVCLALDAMEYGRRLLWTRRHSPDWPDPGPDDLQVLRDNYPNDVAVKYLSQRFLTGRILTWRQLASGAIATTSPPPTATTQTPH